jgi:hypothetical protein
MPYNLPSYTTDNISFGPGRLLIGPSGATPTVDLGAISEDGITLEIGAEKRDIMQGNPKVNVLTFTQVQSVRVQVTGLEYDFTTFSYALGSGNTTASGTVETFAFGGDPFVSQVALQVEHQMAQSGHTMYVDVWKAQSDAGLSVPLTHDEHQFEMAWKAVQASTNWAGATLPQTEQLVRFRRLIA